MGGGRGVSDQHTILNLMAFLRCPLLCTCQIILPFPIRAVVVANVARHSWDGCSKTREPPAPSTAVTRRLLLWQQPRICLHPSRRQLQLCTCRNEVGGRDGGLNESMYGKERKKERTNERKEERKRKKGRIKEIRLLVS